MLYRFSVYYYDDDRFVVCLSLSCSSCNFHSFLVIDVVLNSTRPWLADPTRHVVPCVTSFSLATRPWWSTWNTFTKTSSLPLRPERRPWPVREVNNKMLHYFYYYFIRLCIFSFWWWKNISRLFSSGYWDALIEPTHVPVDIIT